MTTRLVERLNKSATEIQRVANELIHVAQSLRDGQLGGTASLLDEPIAECERAEAVMRCAMERIAELEMNDLERREREV